MFKKIEHLCSSILKKCHIHLKNIEHLKKFRKNKTTYLLFKKIIYKIIEQKEKIKQHHGLGLKNKNPHHFQKI